MTGTSHPDPLVFGHGERRGIVCAERAHAGEADEIVLFVREGDATTEVREPFHPFMWLEKPSLLDGCEVKPEVRSLAGKNVLAFLAVFQSWDDLETAVKHLKAKTRYNPSDPFAPYFFLNDPIQQHLLMTGQAHFKGMRFADLRRMQVDIETYTKKGFEFSNPDREEDRIIAIAMADQSGWTEVLGCDATDEAALLKAFVKTVRERDPDVIEGHNFFKFDLPYLVARAKRHKVKMALGRDGSAPRVRSGRFTVADRTITYPKAEIHGRHIVDTFFLVQVYDVTHRSLEGFGLKEVASHFGVSAPARTYLPGSDIARVYDTEPGKLRAYARDDVIETRAVSGLLSPIYFAQGQILPFSYQNIGVRGNAAKIDALMLREYLRQGHSIPRPGTPKEFAGGYTDIFFEGVKRNVHHCDVRSLYPSVMLKDGLCPRTDDLGVFLKLLDYLKRFRLDAKKRMADSSGEEQVHLDALQSTFKVLINSFYGYLGFPLARFSDFAKAERIAAEGRSLLKQMIEWIRANGGEPVEIDTDGIYFVPPAAKGKAGMEKFREAFQASLPEGIEIEFDGEYRSMFSYKMKNYALLCDNGEIIIKGAALKSRGLEPFQRSFLRDVLRLKLEEKDDAIPALKKRYEQAILKGEWPIWELAKTERLQDAPSTYAAKLEDKGRARNAAYELALKSGREYQAGDQVSYYVTGSKKSVAVHAAAKLATEWDPKNRDENVPYYAAKLDALFRKFADETGDLPAGGGSASGGKLET